VPTQSSPAESPNFDVNTDRVPTPFEICFDPSVPVVGVIEFAADTIVERGIFAYLASIIFYAIIATGYSEHSVRCLLSGETSETVGIFADSALASRNLL
jgi:hypothetical protein